MRCSRCGEECKENQVFCIKCGSPIHVVPDFDLIEAELANSVGELMSDDSEIPDRESTGNTTQNFIPNTTRREKELDLIDIGRKPDKEISKKPEEDPNKPRKNKNLIIGMIVAGVVILIIAIAIIAKVVFGGEKTGDYDSRYKAGMELYNSSDYEAALDELLVAEKLAETDAEKIQIKEAILGAYENIDGKNTEMIAVLKELIELSSEETSYYEKLIAIYKSEGTEEEIQNLINTAPESVYNDIKANGVGAPEITPDSGEFDEVTNVEITAENSTEIYYTVDGSEPTKSSTKYTTPVVISEDGIITLKAIAYGNSGFQSKITENTYKMEISILPAPVVTPGAGEYTESTMITITVPEGYTAYYTYSAGGSAPTTSSDKYTTPVPMIVGNNIFSAIVVSGTGKTSAVTTMIYKLATTN